VIDTSAKLYEIKQVLFRRQPNVFRFVMFFFLILFCFILLYDETMSEIEHKKHLFIYAPPPGAL